MVEIDELFGSKTPMAGDLQAGLKTLALDQKIGFALYGRVVLPLDGFVFWVRADLLAQPTFSSLVTAAQLAAIEEMGDALPGDPIDDSNPYIVQASGSLHYGSDVRQEETETYAANRVVFTTTDEVAVLSAISPNTMWIGQFEGLRFGFSALSMRYRQAGLWHYSGFAIYPDVGPNVIDAVTQFSNSQVLSNSTPAWLGLNSYRPPYAFWQNPPTIFPGFLAPANEPPPFATAHVIPDSTMAVASAPTIDHGTSTHTQLCSERVRVTLWGTRNNAALDFVDMVYQYTLDTEVFGLMGMPVTRDEVRTQSELGVLAMKKSITFEISYLQHRMNDIATQTIRSCVPNVVIGRP